MRNEARKAGGNSVESKTLFRGGVGGLIKESGLTATSCACCDVDRGGGGLTLGLQGRTVQGGDGKGGGRLEDV